MVFSFFISKVKARFGLASHSFLPSVRPRCLKSGMVTDRDLGTLVEVEGHTQQLRVDPQVESFRCPDLEMLIGPFRLARELAFLDVHRQHLKSLLRRKLVHSQRKTPRQSVQHFKVSLSFTRSASVFCCEVMDLYDEPFFFFFVVFFFLRQRHRRGKHV